jgi:hypothetical protein
MAEMFDCIIDDVIEPVKSRMPPMRNNGPDDFQTPPHAVRWLVPYLRKEWRIWEGACGKGNIVRTLTEEGFTVEGTDLKTGTNFLTWKPREFDAIVTNPPYSIKDNFIARCYGLGKPWAMLMPLAALGEQERVGMYAEYGIQLLMPYERINYETPSGLGSGAQFFSAWFCWGMNLPQQITFIPAPDKPEQGRLV